MTEEQRRMIEDCERRGRGLTDWECEFISSISRRDFLTPKQSALLEKLWERVTEDG